MAQYLDFVQDDYKRPIPGAVIKLFQMDGTTLVAETKTAINGQFQLDAPDAKYILLVSYGGESQRSSVIVGTPPEYVGPAGPPGPASPSTSEGFWNPDGNITEEGIWS